ncbi:VOC family protein [Bacillus sp. Marseille-Q3570]|uniref:bleomycin resistance protein n=1 Tax=Bacillus sp. Marseille-Q3570 TaxID=2963522 RepID=UPI0021B793F7|nr:VOC family protein [Bacillus sp. Marseille-Q3570]
MKMLEAIPALPVKDLKSSITFYRDTLGFALVHEEDGFAVLTWDEVEVHLWLADDERWRMVDRPAPVISGAESFIAGTASCRIGMDGVDELHGRLAEHEILHPNAPLGDRPWGVREFAVVDPDNNLITFYERLVR